MNSKFNFFIISFFLSEFYYLPPRLDDPPELLAGAEDLAGALLELLTAGELELERVGAE